MPQLETTFQALRRAGRPALIPFIVGGHPNLKTTGALLLALQDAGADVIEVGVPFSDPLADGPIIQAASAQALRRGATPARVLAAVAAVRSKLKVPVVCLSYWNPILQFGIPRFVNALSASGCSGLIVPDLSVEEGQPLRQAARRARGLSTIFLASPTSSPARLRRIVKAANGFIYYVSITGTTGVRRELPPDLRHGVRQLKLLTTKPICVGFGIATPAQAHAVGRIADGVIVGSALVQRIAAAKTPAAGVQAAARFVKQLRAAL